MAKLFPTLYLTCIDLPACLASSLKGRQVCVLEGKQPTLTPKAIWCASAVFWICEDCHRLPLKCSLWSCRSCMTRNPADVCCSVIILLLLLLLLLVWIAEVPGSDLGRTDGCCELVFLNQTANIFSWRTTTLSSTSFRLNLSWLSMSYRLYVPCTVEKASLSYIRIIYIAKISRWQVVSWIRIKFIYSDDHVRIVIR